MLSSASRASSPYEKVSAITKSTSASAAHPICSSNIATAASRVSESPGMKTFVLQMSPASMVSVSRATDLATARALRFISSTCSTLPITLSFSRCA